VLDYKTLLSVNPWLLVTLVPMVCCWRLLITLNLTQLLGVSCCVRGRPLMSCVFLTILDVTSASDKDSCANAECLFRLQTTWQTRPREPTGCLARMGTSQAMAGPKATMELTADATRSAPTPLWTPQNRSSPTVSNVHHPSPSPPSLTSIPSFACTLCFVYVVFCVNGSG
jgi:hypothetical protein